MAGFSATTSKSVNNCQTLTITDTSNYTDNDNFITKETFSSRFITISNILGTEIETKSLGATGDSVTFDISNILTLAPIALRVRIQLVGVGSSYSIETLYYLPCIL